MALNTVYMSVIPQSAPVALTQKLQSHVSNILPDIFIWKSTRHLKIEMPTVKMVPSSHLHPGLYPG